MRNLFFFIRTHRDGNFQLYLLVLELLTPQIFAHDHVNYSRWMPIHIVRYEVVAISIKDELKSGHWALSSTNKAFSAIPFDQVHEEENACVKGSGGCMGLVDSPDT